MKWFTRAALAVLAINAAAGADELARNVDFTVCAETQDTARRVADRASHLRSQLAVQWLGEEIPSGIGRTIIHVRLDDDTDRGKAWVNDRLDRAPHIVWIQSSDETSLRSTLAHELTHVVFATRYPSQVPVWANEGAASLCDDAGRVKIRQEIVNGFARSGRWPSLEAVIGQRNIRPDDQNAYCVSASLTEYLLSLKDRQTFIQFAVDAQRLGYDRSLQNYYKIRDLAQLERQWRHWASSSTF